MASKKALPEVVVNIPAPLPMGIRCPAQATHVKRQRITREGDHYICNCGVKFEWTSPTRWKVLEDPGGQAEQFNYLAGLEG